MILCKRGIGRAIVIGAGKKAFWLGGYFGLDIYQKRGVGGDDEIYEGVQQPEDSCDIHPGKCIFFVLPRCALYSYGHNLYRSNSLFECSSNRVN